MLVKEIIYFLCIFIFAVSCFNLIYSINNKNKNIFKYIILLSIIFILYSIVDMLILPSILNLDIGFEILIFYIFLLVSSILFVISIIISIIKSKKINTIGKFTKYKIIFLFLIIFPILMFCFSYYRERYYINNSKLILVCKKGEEFSEKSYAYAISKDYTKKITIGANFRGYAMKKHLPSSFYDFKYTWRTDRIVINNDNITILRNDKIKSKMDITNTISYCNVVKVFFKQ